MWFYILFGALFGITWLASHHLLVPVVWLIIFGAAALVAASVWAAWLGPKYKEQRELEEGRRKLSDLYGSATSVAYPQNLNFTFDAPAPFRPIFKKIASALYAQEFPPIPPPPELTGRLTYSHHQAWSTTAQRRANLNASDGLRRFEQTLAAAFSGVLNALPPYLPSAFTTRLIDVPDIVPSMAIALDAFWHNDFAIDFRNKFHENRLAYSASVLTKKELDAGKYLNPHQHRGTPQQALDDFYTGTVFYDLLQGTYPFQIPTESRFAGTWIIAPPGRGKTNLLHNMIAQDLKERCTVVLMDSKGDLINGYKGLPGVVVIDPATANINPLQLGSSTRSVEFLEYIFGALLETSMTPLQKTLFRSVLTVLIKVPNATLETFRQILTIGWKPLDIEQYIQLCDPATQDFFLTGKPPEFDNATYRETKQQILWRLRLILSNEYLRNIFTSPTTNIQFSELLNSGKIIVIDNSKDDLGEEGAEFFGRFFVALTWMAAVTRSRLRPNQKMPVYLYIDECQSVIRRDEKIATILDECRSQKIALILAHQRVAQIIAPNVLDALGNCAIRVANSDEDAPSLAPRFRVEPSALRLSVGKFACFVRDKTPQALTVTVPEFDLSTLPDPPPRSHHAPPSPARPKPREEGRTQSNRGAAPKDPLDFG